MKPDISTCYHEAGHAVAAVVLGRAIKKVDVYPISGRSGVCVSLKQPPGEKIFKKCGSIKKFMRFLREFYNRAILCVLAGPMAGCKYSGRTFTSHCPGDSKDYKTVALLLKNYNNSFPKTLEIEGMSQIAALLINEPEVWKAITFLAGYLENFHEIDGKSVRDYVNRNIPKKRRKELKKDYSFLSIINQLDQS